MDRIFLTHKPTGRKVELLETTGHGYVYVTEDREEDAFLVRKEDVEPNATIAILRTPTWIPWWRRLPPEER